MRTILALFFFSLIGVSALLLGGVLIYVGGSAIYALWVSYLETGLTEDLVGAVVVTSLFSAMIGTIGLKCCFIGVDDPTYT